jgi:hypothetical protein
VVAIRNVDADQPPAWARAARALEDQSHRQSRPQALTTSNSQVLESAPAHQAAGEGEGEGEEGFMVSWRRSVRRSSRRPVVIWGNDHARHAATNAVAVRTRSNRATPAT